MGPIPASQPPLAPHQACSTLHHMPALWKTMRNADKQPVIVCKTCGKFIGYPPAVSTKK